MLTVLRPELVATWIEYNKDLVRKQRREARKKEQESETEKESKEGKEEIKEEGKEKEDLKEKEQRELEEDEKDLGDFSLNPNALCGFNLGGSKEEIEKDEENVRKISRFLTETLIPITVRSKLCGTNYS